MVLAYALLFLPAFALSKDSVAIVPAEDLKVCEYFDARIIRLREIVNKELLPDVDIGSDLYITLEESKLCDTVGYVAIPECVANNGGDECVARKTSELIRKTLRAAMKAEKIKAVPSGEKFFATCKHIGYKNVLKTFKSARTLMSPECGLPGQKGGRNKRNTDLLPALLLGGSYDPSSIWFQYFLCKDIDLYCYFFTQGWTQGQYGQYYLYDNLLDDSTGLFAGATDSNLATIALLGGLGGGIGQPSGYYPSYGAHAAPAPGRKRREESNGADDGEDDDARRKRRETCEDGNAADCSRKRRGVNVEEEKDEESGSRKRRETCYNEKGEKKDCNRKRREEDDKEGDEKEGNRKRRETCYNEKGEKKDCNRKRREKTDEDEGGNRKRREVCYNNMGEEEACRRKRQSPCDNENNADCDRKRRNACDACNDNEDSTECKECYR